MFRLKKGQETFQVVDGPDAGKTFKKGVVYDKAPAGYETRFEKKKIQQPVAPKTLKEKGSN